jgi:Transketolase, C-terminal subunit
MQQFNHYKEALIASIIDLAKEDDKVVFLDADLSSCIGSTAFQAEFPERFFNCGIAEGNMAAVAAGLASTGMVPFIHSFGCFASRRDYDQLFISVGYTHQTVHVIGSDPGITAQYNGGTHMPFEDIALFRQIPDFVIVEPSDDYSLYQLVQQIYKNGKSSYIRTPRKGVVHRYGEGDEIVLGKAKTLADGEDVAIVALGALMVDEAMKAKDMLAEKGIKATVIDLLSVRPIDWETIDAAAAKCGKMLVCENGRYAGGVGELIAGHLVAQNPIKMDFVNVGERFGEVGNLAYLKEAFGFNAETIAAKAEALAAK